MQPEDPIPALLEEVCYRRGRTSVILEYHISNPLLGKKRTGSAKHLKLVLFHVDLQDADGRGCREDVVQRTDGYAMPGQSIRR